MKLHTTLSNRQLSGILNDLHRSGQVDDDVHLIILKSGTSRSHPARIDLSLGLMDKNATHRRARNMMGTDDGGYRYAATFDDWGWFIAGVFAADASARFAGAYDSPEDFDTKTWQAYTTVTGVDPFPFAPIEPHPQNRRYTVEEATRFPWLGLTFDPRGSAIRLAEYPVSA